PKSTSSPIFIVTLWWTVILTLIKLFESSLLEILTVFLYPILLLFGYFGLLILLVLSVIYWIRQRNNSERPFIPFLFSILTIIFFLYFPFTRLTLEIDFRVKKSDREKVVKMITNKEIQ